MLILPRDLRKELAVPVTARLSRKSYEQFGDDLTNELVEWFNQVDAAYRSEFRDLFELHFARFDAKLEQRVGELRAEIFGTLDSKLGAVDSKLSSRSDPLPMSPVAHGATATVADRGVRA